MYIYIYIYACVGVCNWTNYRLRGATIKQIPDAPFC